MRSMQHDFARKIAQYSSVHDGAYYQKPSQQLVQKFSTHLYEALSISVQPLKSIENRQQSSFIFETMVLGPFSSSSTLPATWSHGHRDPITKRCDLEAGIRRCNWNPAWDFIEVVKQQVEIVPQSGGLTEADQMPKNINSNCIGTCKVLLDRLQELKASASTKYRKWKYLHEGLKLFSGTGASCEGNGSEGRYWRTLVTNFKTEDLDLLSKRPETSKTQIADSITEKDHATATSHTSYWSNSSSKRRLWMRHTKCHRERKLGMSRT